MLCCMTCLANCSRASIRPMLLNVCLYLLNQAKFNELVLPPKLQLVLDCIGSGGFDELGGRIHRLSSLKTCTKPSILVISGVQHLLDPHHSSSACEAFSHRSPHSAPHLSPYRR